MDETVAILTFTAVGFVAQLVDGALGMAYGLTATSVLLGLGTAPAVASASVHAAEVFTTAASGAAHWRLGNVVPRLVLRLALPGALGGALGAWLLTDLPPDIVRPAINAYLLIMAGVILWRAVRWVPFPPLARSPPSAPTGEGPEAAAATAAAAMPAGRTATLGAVGGFLDATGGGGWGPTVAATLLGGGGAPRQVIGSTNAAEFFVTLTISTTFLATIGLELWPVITGLVLGGALAAPLAALLTRRLPPRVLMFAVAGVIALLALRGIARYLAMA